MGTATRLMPTVTGTDTVTTDPVRGGEGWRPPHTGARRSARIPPPMKIVRLFLSPGHNFFGHHGRPAGTHPMIEAEAVECLSGRGLRGDRFLDYRAEYKGQVSFFAEETYLDLCRDLGVHDRPPSVFRRNVLTRGVDLTRWIGSEFEIQGVRFFGTEHCRPCAWMNEAFAAGAEAALQGRGGLRAQVLSDGWLRRDAEVR